jgi:hypothetical protein
MLPATLTVLRIVDMIQLTLEAWDSMRPKERETLAKHLVKELPSGFGFNSIQPHRLGGEKHEVAIYDFGQMSFALIVGGTPTLGYDAARPWEPTPEELTSWQGTAREYGIEESLQAHIRATTLQPRNVVISPFLIETSARELGWEPISLSDLKVQEILAKYPSDRTFGVLHAGHVRIQREADGTMLAHRAQERTHADLVAEFAKEGFRSDVR